MITVKDLKIRLIEVQEARRTEVNSLNEASKNAVRKDRQQSLFDDNGGMSTKRVFTSNIDRLEYQRAKTSIARIDKRIDLLNRVIEYLSGEPTIEFLQAEFARVKNLIDDINARSKMHFEGDIETVVKKNNKGYDEWKKLYNVTDLQKKLEVLRTILQNPKEKFE